MRLRRLCVRGAAPMLALACAFLSTGSLALPDLQRGIAALQRGDATAAEADLLPLAEQGYPQAQAALGRLYSAQDTPEARGKALRWLSAAAATDPSLRVPLARTLMRSGNAADATEADRLLKSAAGDLDAGAPALQLRLYREFPQLVEAAAAAKLAAKLAASAKLEDRVEAVAWYRANALVQPLHAKALAALCEKHRSQIEECHVDLARHFRATQATAAQTQLIREVNERFAQQRLSPETLERVARSLSADDLPGAPSIAAAYAMLAKIKNPSPTVTARRARLLMVDRNLDAKADPETLLRTAHGQGSTEAALYLGRMYVDDRNTTADPVQAERLLAEAATTLPAAHLYLGRMYERGVDGQMDAKRALTHYLLAARAGHPNADLALARMYWVNRGVKVNPVYAYAFARLAVHAAALGAPEFIVTLNSALDAEQIAQGQRLAEREFAARKAAANVPQSAGAPITTAEVRVP